MNNDGLHKDFHLPTITDYIKKLAINYFNHINSARSMKFYRLSDPPSVYRYYDSSVNAHIINDLRIPTLFVLTSTH